MTDRERKLAILNYEPYDRLPIVHFGFWSETLRKWAAEGHLSEELARSWGDGNPADAEVSELLGFDSDWYRCLHTSTSLRPGFEGKVIKELPDGSKHVRDHNGVVLLQRPEAGSIPAEIEHLLTDRKSWDKHYKWRYEWDPERVTQSRVLVNRQFVRYDQGGLDFLRADDRDYMYGLHCGSLIGEIRNIIGITGLSYMQVDDPELLEEIIDTNAELCYRNTEKVLSDGAKFDFAHFWEDVCFKNGPLISPKLMRDTVGPHYKRITDLCHQHGIQIVSLDCDGCIDTLVPIWLENGVNTMFPIEVGTWNAEITPWRETYGKELRGVGGMNKVIFSLDRAAIDAEIERLRPLIELGGYIPCPDHRIAPDAKWDLVRYYCDRMRESF